MKSLFPKPLASIFKTVIKIKPLTKVYEGFIDEILGFHEIASNFTYSQK